MKICTKCKKAKSIDEFYTQNEHKDKHTSLCKKCVDINNKTYYEKNKEKASRYSLEHYHKNKEKYNRFRKKRRFLLKKNTIGHYGEKCACCGENNLAFLTIDHINGDGYKHRLQIGRGGSAFYAWLKHNNYPEGFQVLCWNCNCGKQVNNGICPHKNVEPAGRI